MYCNVKKPCHFFLGILLTAILAVNVAPISLMANKPANSDSSYSAGWKEGCQSGINAGSPIHAMLFDQPYVRQVKELGANYQNGWNEAYTTCHFAKVATDSWIQFLTALIAIFYYGNALVKKNTPL